MALLITLDNVYSLYPLDSSNKMNGIVFLRQSYQALKNYSKHSRLFDGLLLGFVVKGSMKMQIHFLDYEVHVGDIAVLPPQTMIETKSVSQDLEIVTIGLSFDFIADYPILREFVLHNQIRWQPILHSPSNEIAIQEELIALIEKIYQKEDSPNKAEMLKHLVLVLIHKMSEHYGHLPASKSLLKNRTHQIIDDFYALLSNYAHEQRSVTFYAKKLHLSSSYLSSFLKQHTGKSTLQWIDYVLILDAKTKLKSTHLSIKEISNALNFTETSVFCRYFKKHTGLSPKSYREE